MIVTRSAGYFTWADCAASQSANVVVESWASALVGTSSVPVSFVPK
jgi:hypothetical protein